MSALIGALRASLSLETAQFEAGAKRAQRTAAQTRSSFQKSFGGLGNVVKAGFAGVISGLSLGLIVQGARASLEYAGSLKEVSDQLGVTTRDLQVFRYAASQVGVSQDTLETGLKRLTTTMGQLAAGAKAPRAALDAVRKGLADQVLAARDTGDAFRIIADALKNVTDRSQRAAVEVAIFKRGGVDLDNVLVGGAKSLDDYAEALDKVGGILSDEEIQSADLTADKIEQLNTQLKANIAGAIARNSGAILDLANSLIFLVSKIGKALTAWNDFKNALDAQAFDTASKNPFLSAEKRAEGAERAARARGKISDSGVAWGVAGSKVIIELPPINAATPKPDGPDIGKFLSGGGGGGRSKKDDSARLAEQERQRAFNVSQETLRADLDVLRAKQSLATDFTERAALSIEILNLEKKGFEEELAFRVQEGELKKVEADRLRLAYEERDAIERKAVLAEEEAQRLRDSNMLDDKDVELKLKKLELEADIAETAQDRRRAELRILDLLHKDERDKLERIIRESKDWAEIEAARRELLELTQRQSLERQATIQRTRGPFEQAQADFSDVTEEMENLKVQGIMGAADALTALKGGFNDFKDAALSAIKQVIAEFIRLQTLKFLFNLIGSSVGAPGASSAPGGGAMFSPGNPGVGFAGGGSFIVNGLGGLDSNVLAINGIPMAKVDNRERISIDSVRHGRGGDSPVNISFAISGPVTRETQMQIAAATRRGIAQANRKGM